MIGLWLANLLNKQVRGRKVFRTLIYLPTLVPLVATAMIFKMVLAPSGPLNDVLGWFGIHGPSWLLRVGLGQAGADPAVRCGVPAARPYCCSRQ